ncbi:hypothetical protein, partial [Sphingobacterium daejeonense]|uniref:hypothetical protein n=1 Tax=Sphingobacterium daejeonense TaxID=371142 RepID=UPI003D31C3D4
MQKKFSHNNTTACNQCCSCNPQFLGTKVLLLITLSDPPGPYKHLRIRATASKKTYAVFCLKKKT